MAASRSCAGGGKHPGGCANCEATFFQLLGCNAIRSRSLPVVAKPMFRGFPCRPRGAPTRGLGSGTVARDRGTCS